jgi:hypothetical protein
MTTHLLFHGTKMYILKSTLYVPDFIKNECLKLYDRNYYLTDQDRSFHGTFYFHLQ